MKLIIPMARRQYKNAANFSPPSPLMSIAGRPILLRVLDAVKSLDFSEVIFIVDSDDSALKKLIAANFKFKVRYILQKNQKGVAHAIYGAKKFMSSESCLILFADSILKANLKSLDKLEGDAIIWTKEVDNPSLFGVVFTHDGLISRLIEKPETPVSDLAMVGMYYVKSSDKLFDAIAYLIKNKILTKGAYQITDAFQIMINRGARILPRKVSSWLDCGTKKRLLEAHKALIVDQKTASLAKSNVLIRPVFIEGGVKILNSVIGPNVSIGQGAKISSSIISNSIVGEGALVESGLLDESFIGSEAKVLGSLKKVNLKDRGVIRDE
ncbi:MAG: sugar phosphate nucleotidyltransferase [Candidatus Woesearchaeota archaeon]